MSALTAIKGFCSEHSPEILVGAGVVGFVTTIVLACKATTKLEDILDEAEEKRDKIENFDPDEFEDVEYSESDRKKDIKLHTMQTRIKIFKLYAIPVAIGVASIASILVGFKILKGRYLLVTSAYASLEAVHRRYRDRIRDKFGDIADEYGETGIWREQTTYEKVTVDPETGEEKRETVTEEKKVLIDPVDQNGAYFRLICPGTYLWDKYHGDKELIKQQLIVFQSEYNRLYQRGDYVNYNENLIKDMFAGQGKTDIGALSGRCKYDKASEEALNQPYIDLGCFEYVDDGRGSKVPELKLVGTTTFEGENIEVPYIDPNFTMISFANISKVRDSIGQAPKDNVKVRRGGKYISQGGI